jgi:hypothetical protein
MKEKLFLCVVAVTFAAECIPSSSVVPSEKNGNKDVFQNNITMRDNKGRAKFAQMITPYGSCMSEVVYWGGVFPPEIHVVVKKRGMRNIGHYIFNGETEETMTNKIIEEYMTKAVDEVCLPLLLPGYEKI